MLEDFFLFVDRTEAGEKLAAKLLDEPLIQDGSREELLVLSIPRGGVVVGAPVARILGCAHEVIAVKKIGFPGHQETAIGAMAEDGTIVLNPQVMRQFDNYLKQAIEWVRGQIEDNIQKFRQEKVLDVTAKTVIVVDDGIATGETMKAAVVWLRSRDSTQQPKKILVAVPVCSSYAAEELRRLADKFVCLVMPQWFWAVGQFYWDFDQVSDEEVINHLLSSTLKTPQV